jgi:hypothetical protein
MPNSTYFIQECPTCGRRVQIRVEYLGRNVVCRHCQGQLTAADPATMRFDGETPADALLRRADELLDSLAEKKPQPRPIPR